MDFIDDHFQYCVLVTTANSHGHLQKKAPNIGVTGSTKKRKYLLKLKDGY